MENTASTKALAAALQIFHNRVEAIKKDASNPFFHSKYATLSAILTAIKEPLKESGLIFTQWPHGDNELTTTLIHPETGEHMRDTFKMTPARNDPQGQGSAITYMRRYALGAILGLNIEEDDDGNAASATKAPTGQSRGKKPYPATALKEGKATIGQIDYIRGMSEEKGIDPKTFLTRFNLKKANELTSEQASTIIEELTSV